MDVFIEDFKARIERQKAMSACDESVTAGLELASLGTRRSMEMPPHESVKVDILICSLFVDAAAKLHVLGRDHRSVKHSAYMMARHIEAVAPNHDCEYHRRVIAAALAP